jgi:hypothetical protein
MFNRCRNLLLLGVSCVLFTACSSVEYVSHRDVKHLKSSGLAADDVSKKRQYGALLFKKKAARDGSQDARAFVIRKDRSAYVAETMLMDNSDDGKASFDRSYLSFGADKKHGIVGFKLRFTY